MDENKADTSFGDLLAAYGILSDSLPTIAKDNSTDTDQGKQSTIPPGSADCEDASKNIGPITINGRTPAKKIKQEIVDVEYNSASGSNAGCDLDSVPDEVQNATMPSKASILAQTEGSVEERDLQGLTSDVVKKAVQVEKRRHSEGSSALKTALSYTKQPIPVVDRLLGPASVFENGCLKAVASGETKSMGLTVESVVSLRNAAELPQTELVTGSTVFPDQISHGQSLLLPKAASSKSGTNTIASQLLSGYLNSAKKMTQSKGETELSSSDKQLKDKSIDCSKVNEKDSSEDGVLKSALSDLLSNKNYIPAFKFKIPPEDIDVKIKDGGYVCNCCGDAFAFKSSWLNHRSRKSMEISFHCSACASDVVILNKCLVFEHMQSHNDVGTTLKKLTIIPVPKTVQSFLTSTLKSELMDLKPQSSVLMENVTMNENSVKSCPICCETVGSRPGALRLHFAPKGNSKHLKCPKIDCVKMLPTLCALTAHSCLHSHSGPFVCPECGIKIPGSFEIYLKHVHKKCFHHTRVLQYQCPSCYAIYDKAKVLESHIISAHSEQYFKCVLCPMAFRNPNDIIDHFQKVHPNQEKSSNKKYSKLIKCSICFTVFSEQNQSSNIIKHTFQHVIDMERKLPYTYKCQICHNYEPDREKFLKHLASCHNVKPLNEMCGICGVEFSTTSLVNKHMKDCHDDYESSDDEKMKNAAVAQQTITLTLANKKSTTSSATTSPKVLATVFKCSKCQLMFTSRDEAITHMYNVHHMKGQNVVTVPRKNIAPLMIGNSLLCPVCRSEFYRKNKSFYQHVKDHEKEGKYVCKVCCKEYFIGRSKLLEHRKVCKNTHNASVSNESVKGLETMSKQNEEKGYKNKKPILFRKEIKCDLCPVVFPSSNKLYAHMKIDHDAVPQFSCHLCGLSYEDSCSLKEHVMRIHEGKGRAYACYACAEKDKTATFYKKNNLERHLASYHKISRHSIDYSKIAKVNVKIDLATDNKAKDSGINGEKRKLESVDIKYNSENVKKLKIQGETKYSCAKCNFSSEDRKQFHEHISAHKTESDALQCLECGMCFMAYPALKKHLILVHKIKNFTEYYSTEGVNYDDIEEADVQLPVVANLKDGSKSTGDPLECRVCFQSFRNTALLKNHMRTHGVAYIRSKRVKTPVGKCNAEEIVNVTDS